MKKPLIIFVSSAGPHACPTCNEQELADRRIANSVRWTMARTRVSVRTIRPTSNGESLPDEVVRLIESATLLVIAGVSPNTFDNVIKMLAVADQSVLLMSPSMVAGRDRGLSLAKAATWVVMAQPTLAKFTQESDPAHGVSYCRHEGLQVAVRTSGAVLACVDGKWLTQARLRTANERSDHNIGRWFGVLASQLFRQAQDADWPDMLLLAEAAATSSDREMIASPSELRRFAKATPRKPLKISQPSRSPTNRTWVAVASAILLIGAVGPSYAGQAFPV